MLKIINYLLIFLLNTIRPLLGPSSCRFSTGCTKYAILQLQEHNLLIACWNIFKRLCACNPWNNQTHEL